MLATLANMTKQLHNLKKVNLKLGENKQPVSHEMVNG